MTTLRLQLATTDLTTRMWHKPGVKLWVFLFATETEVAGRTLGLVVLVATLWTARDEVVGIVKITQFMQ